MFLNFANSIGLLTLTISANFTGDLFGCSIRKQLNNLLVKHATAFLLLLFFIVLTNKDEFTKNVEYNKLLTPTLLYNTFLLYMGFIAFTKCTFEISVFIIAILLFILFIEIEKSNKDDTVKKEMDKYKKYAIILMIGALITGIVLYYKKQKLDHNDFSIYKFLLGSTKCSNIN